MVGWNEETQLRLKKAHVFVAGAGGLGSPVLLYLAAAGFGSITICDFDTVAESNLNRQVIHSESSLNRPKVESAAEAVRRLNPEISVNPVPERIQAGSAEKLIEGSDLVFDCLDNFKTRQILNRAAVKKSIPLVHAGIEGFMGQLSFIHPPETPCLNCFLPGKDSGIATPVLGATAGLVGSLQALEGIKFFTGLGECLKNRILFIDATSMNFETVTVMKNPKCVICGKSKGGK